MNAYMLDGSESLRSTTDEVHLAESFVCAALKFYQLINDGF
jgi:hypothetical protein